MVGRQPHLLAAFTLGEIPGTHFSEAESTSEHMVLSGVPRKKSPVTPPGIDPGTSRLVAQCLNHYVTPGPHLCNVCMKITGEAAAMSSFPTKLKENYCMFLRKATGKEVFMSCSRHNFLQCCMVYRKITAEDVLMSSYPVTRNNSQDSVLRNVTSAYQLRQKLSLTLIRLDP